MSSSESVTIAGIFDLSSFSWGESLFNFTVARLKNEDPSLHSSLRHVVVDAACDETTAVRAYWKLRTDNNNVPVHGIVGARCSGASVSLARLAGLEQVNMVSPSATSSILSDVEEFPYFSRLVAPDNSRGEVGALVETLKWFGWKQVSILSTDSLYAKDYVSEFRTLWEGQDSSSGRVTYSNVIRVNAQGQLDMGSVDTALREVPTDDPANNSRIILLVAQNQHAYPILARAREKAFQPDTIWIGTSSWVGRDPPSNVPGPEMYLGEDELPGYIGLGPIRHSNAEIYLEEYNLWAQMNQEPTFSQFPAFAAEMIDSITALVRAIYALAPSFRRDGYAVRQQLWRSSFEGATGPVRFTTVGDRRDPLYSVLHLKRGVGGNLEWTNVGESGITAESAWVDLSQLCFATLGCSLTEIPSDAYPVPPLSLPTWIIVLLVILIILFIAVVAKYHRSRLSKRKIKKELETFRDSVVGMRTAEALYIPFVAKKMDQKEEQAKKNCYSLERVQWCWKETDFAMAQHDANEIVGDPSNCWIKYSDDDNDTLENAFQMHKQGWQGKFSPLPGYMVDFSTMLQTKQATGFTREVQRLVDASSSSDDPKDPFRTLPASVRDTIDSDEIKYGDELPEDIKNEPQMVLVPGDVIQISKQKKDSDWAFGTKLYHRDENMARSIVSGMTRSTASTASSDEDEVNVLADTGWFQMEATRVPTTEDLQALKQNVGDTDALNAPSNWNTVADPSVVQVQELKKEDAEYKRVERAFNSSLGKKVKIASIKRVENLAMWQSYVVKRQTILSRELGDDTDTNNRKRQRLERRWLWHGTNVEVMDKILQQGFNRSFCGKNATMYGKGVYFARDTSYSSYPTYAVPDSKGYQYIMACRVVVGEYCPGVQNALTPDVRDPSTHRLYDSTVGLMSGDSMSNPSIYVTYHDAQAYPEYLIKFKA